MGLGQRGLARGGIKAAENVTLGHHMPFAQRFVDDEARGLGAQFDDAVGLGAAPHDDGTVDFARLGMQGHDAHDRFGLWRRFGQRFGGLRVGGGKKAVMLENDHIDQGRHHEGDENRKQPHLSTFGP